eukprot:12249732-Karenia_brevis.AAC.1
MESTFLDCKKVEQKPVQYGMVLTMSCLLVLQMILARMVLRYGSTSRCDSSCRTGHRCRLALS